MVTLLASAAAFTNYDVSITKGTPTFGSFGATFPIAVSADDSLGGVELGLTALPTTVVMSSGAVGR